MRFVLRFSNVFLGSSYGKSSEIIDKNELSYGKSSEIIDKNELIKIQKNFMKEKQKCKVDFHCFCNQGIDHVWAK